MPRITISYRRDDSLDITGRIFDRLGRRDISSRRLQALLHLRIFAADARNAGDPRPDVVRSRISLPSSTSAALEDTQATNVNASYRKSRRLP
jgi:hypothetical protein